MIKDFIIIFSKILRIFIFLILISLEAEALDISKIIENYFSQHLYWQSYFIQHSSRGKIVKGYVWLKKAQGKEKYGKLRIDYEKKEEQRLISREGWLYIYDLKDNSYESIDIHSTPFSFLLSKSNLKNFMVSSYQKEGTNLFVSIKQPKEDFGSITLIFSIKDTGKFIEIKDFKGWCVVENDGTETEVSLNNQKETRFEGKIFYPPFKEERNLG